MARNIFPDKWESAKGGYLKELNEIEKETADNIPDTFENYFIKVRNNHTFNDQQTNDMFKAYELGPDRVELFDEFICYYELQRDTLNSNKFCRMRFDRQDISPGILNWNYNVLASLDSNSILITNGDNDTYPAWILQTAQNFRKDVIIVNINLITIERYRDKLFAEKNINPFKQDTSAKNGFDIMKGILKHLVKNSNGRSVYFSLTLNPMFYKDIKDKSYLTGLAFKYSEKGFDNMKYLIKNYEDNWLLDYLKADFINDLSVSVVNQLNVNYLPIFAKLYNYYKSNGKDEQGEYVRNLAISIGQKGDHMEYYKNLFEQ